MKRRTEDLTIGGEWRGPSKPRINSIRQALLSPVRLQHASFALLWKTGFVLFFMLHLEKLRQGQVAAPLSVRFMSWKSGMELVGMTLQHVACQFAGLMPAKGPREGRSDLHQAMRPHDPQLQYLAQMHRASALLKSLCSL